MTKHNKNILYGGNIIILLLVILAMVWTNDHVYAKGSSSSDTQKDNTVVRVMLDWVPNTNHVGLYVAQKQGYFSDRNLSVEILPTAETSVGILVGAGKVDFGIFSQPRITFARAEKIPIVAVAAIIQHNTSGFASLASSNIRTPKDFIGKNYGAFGSLLEEATMTSLLAPYGNTADDITFVLIGSLDFFQGTKQGLFDFSWIYEGWTGMEAKVKGVALNFIPVKDLNPVFDYYAPMLISSEEYLKNNNAIAREFVQAAKEGYKWAIAHPEGAATILYEYVNTLDLTLLKESMKYLAPKFQDDAQEWGTMTDVRWKRYTNWLQDNEFIDSSFTIDGAYTNTLLQE